MESAAAVDWELITITFLFCRIVEEWTMMRTAKVVVVVTILVPVELVELLLRSVRIHNGNFEKIITIIIAMAFKVPG